MSAQAGIVERFVDALLRRDWAGMAATVTDDVYRVGFEGVERDSVRGRDDYVAWTVKVVDPLFEYRWTIHRLDYAADGRTAFLEATSHYRVVESDEPFGYEMAIVFDVTPEALISGVRLYWQTPPKKLPVGTITEAAEI